MSASPKLLPNAVDAIGNTPLVHLANFSKHLPGNILGKLENQNPMWSVKDRLAYALIRSAEEKGLTGPETIFFEPSSGNTGIGLAWITAVRGYQLKVVMPESASVERRRIMMAFGAEVILTPATGGMAAAVKKAKELVAKNSNHVMGQQFENPANVEIHRKTTAEEIWQATGGEVDIFIAGVGTGGTITGVGSLLKERRPEIKIVAVEPKRSPVLSQTLSGKPVKPAPHKIQGIGAGFVPRILDLSLIDEVITVEDEDAYQTTRNLALCEGILCGPSSGAAAWAAQKLARRVENKKKNIVTILPDLGERYLSTSLFNHSFS